MRVTVNYKRVAELLDVLLARWRAKPRQYPFNRKDAILPQTTLPKELRENQYTLACFYFYLCIYMRGGIESLQVFKALIKMWRDHPHLFEPAYVAMLKPSQVQPILKEYIGWDSKAASRYWVGNSRRLMQHWRGNPLLLIKGVRSYKEALRRIRRKGTARERRNLNQKYWGFLGFQYKMVSMFVYFCDFEGWFELRFLYPSPADFHNFRLAVATGAMVIRGMKGNGSIDVDERLSLPWRRAVVQYMRERGADPIEVADVLWLFSLTMCGNSPATTTKSLNRPLDLSTYINARGKWNFFSWAGAMVSFCPSKKPSKKPARSLDLLAHIDANGEWDFEAWALRQKKGFITTCLVCPFLSHCKYGIPSRAYYRQGLFVLRPRPRIEEVVDPKMVPLPVVDNTPTTAPDEQQVMFVT